MRYLFVAVLCLAMASLAVAAPAPVHKPSTQASGQPDAFAMPTNVALTAQQKQKLESLKKEYAPRLADADAQLDRLLTSAQRRTYESARKQALAAGKGVIGAQDAGVAALKLSSKEESRLREALGARAQLVADINQRKAALLKSEQAAGPRPRPRAVGY